MLGTDIDQRNQYNYFLVDVVDGNIAIVESYKSETNQIEFVVQKDGEDIKVTYTLPKTKYYKQGEYTKSAPNKDGMIIITPKIQEKTYNVEVK